MRPRRSSSTAAEASCASARLLLSVTVRSDDVHGAFSPDGERIVVTEQDRATVWDTASGRQLAAYPGGGEALWDAAFSADGNEVLVADEGSPVRVWAAELDRRSAAQIHRYTRCHVPLRLDEGRLLVAETDAAACSDGD